MKPRATTPRSQSQPRRRPNTDFLDAARVLHGPAHIIGRVFLKAEQVLRERGVTLSFATFEELAEVNRLNRDTWRPLLPHFDPDCGYLNEHNSYCLLGRDSRGDVVACQGGRFYEWHDTNFFEEARTMRLFYPDPDRPPPPTESVLMTAERSRQVSGRVVFSGAGWYRPDYRKKDLGTILARVSRALAYTRWKTDATATLMVEGVFKGGFGGRAGYTNFDWALDLRNFAIGSPRMAVLWMQSDQMLEDLSWFLESFGSDVDSRVHNRGPH
jgi:hypothetical protein